MSSSYCDKYKLHPAVFYRQYLDQVVLYHTAKQIVCSYRGSMADVLNCFKNYSDVDEVLSQLETLYSIGDKETFRESINEFVDDLKKREILIARFRQKGKLQSLEKQISSKMTDENQLFSVLFELTYKCNEFCRHCYIVDEGRPELSTEKVFDILNQLKDLNVLNVVFTGGELFTRKDAFQILEQAYSLGFVIDIFTNGTLLNGDDIIRIKQIWPRSIHFSLYSYLAEHHDNITQIPGSFDKTIHSIKSCVAVGIPVNIKMPVFAETVDDVRSLIEYTKELGCTIEVGGNITPKKNGNLYPEAMRISNSADEEILLKLIDEMLPIEKTDKEVVRSRKLCGAGDHSLSINPYGEVFPCNVFPMKIGDVSENTLREIWYQSENLQWWRNNNKREFRIGCKDCIVGDQCAFCPGEAFIRKGNPLKKYDKACRETYFAISRNHEERKEVYEG